MLGRVWPFVTFQCHHEVLSSHRIAICNMYKTPFLFLKAVYLFCDPFIPGLVSFMSDYLYFVAVDFNHALSEVTRCSLWIWLNIVSSPKGGNPVLDQMINYHSF